MTSEPILMRKLLRFPCGLLLAVLSVATISLYAQNTQPTPAPSSTQQPTTQSVPRSAVTERTPTVVIPVVVRDKKGNIVSNLTRNDFTIDEGGRPQQIVSFLSGQDIAHDRNPVTVGLVVDTSFSQRDTLPEERTASATFIGHIFRPDVKDQGFLIHFDKEVELLQDLTPSTKKLSDALRLLDTPELEDASQGQGGGGQGGGGQGGQGGGGQGGQGGGGQGSGYRRPGNLLYDAVFLASGELMQKQAGRKALIVLSDGVDRGSKESLQSAIDAAQRANTTVYSILFKGEQESTNNGYGHHHGGWGVGGPGMGGGGYPGGGRYPQQQREQRPDGKKILDRISRETGGHLFEVSKKDPVDQIYSQIEQELRDQYILAYVPDNSPSDTDYRKIHVATTQKDLTVQARDGYFAPSKPATSAAQ